jgi:hypothetical protein
MMTTTMTTTMKTMVRFSPVRRLKSQANFCNFCLSLLCAGRVEMAMTTTTMVSFSPVGGLRSQANLCLTMLLVSFALEWNYLVY